QVSNLALSFKVLSPMSSPTVDVTVQGTATIAGAAVDVRATAGPSGALVSANLQSQVTLPLGTLVSSYLQGLSGIAAPSSLTIDSLGASIDSSGLRFGGS